MKRYVANTEYLLREIAGDSILFKWEKGGISNESVIVFNETGAFLWKQLSVPRTEAQLTEILCDGFQLDKETASKDVSLFIIKCIQESILIEQAAEE